MAPKTKSRTAIWFYAKECMDNGKIKVNNVRDAIEGIYPEWKAMVPHERAPYERQCENWRREIKLEKNIKPEIGLKLNHNRNDMDDLELANNQQDLSEFLARLALIKKEGDPSVPLEAIKKQHWYFINFQTFCKSDVNPDPNEDYDPYFVLAEVALLEYSLEKGIVDEYHAFIKPNKIPLGYTSQCMDCSKEEHQIPLNFDQAKKNYAEITSNIKNFLKPKQENNSFVPVFCMAKDLEATKFGLQYLFNNSPSQYNAYPFKKVYDLESLVVNLGKQSEVDYSIASANDLLTSYSYDYTANSRCTYHEDLGLKFCSLGIVKKVAYLISDNVCQHFDITLSTNHLPEQKIIGTVVYRDDYKMSRLSAQSRDSKTYLNELPAAKRRNYNNEDNESSYSRNMPCTDIRKRQLVSEKFEKAATNSTVSNSYQAYSRYDQYQREIGNNYDTSSVISDSIESNISSSIFNSKTQYQNAQELDDLEEDDEDGWTKIEKTSSRDPRKYQPSSSSMISNMSSSTINDNDSIRNSSTRSFRGRGKPLNWNKP